MQGAGRCWTTNTPPSAATHQQAALGDLGTQGGVLVGVLQEVHHLDQLQLGAIAALGVAKLEHEDWFRAAGVPKDAYDTDGATAWRGGLLSNT